MTDSCVGCLGDEKTFSEHPLFIPYDPKLPAHQEKVSSIDPQLYECDTSAAQDPYVVGGEVLDFLFAHEFSANFRNPIDPKVLGLVR